MSGSGGEDVRVNISADASDFEGPLNKSYDAAKNFADALRMVGNDLRKVTPEMLGITTAASGMADAISKATASARDSAVTFGAFSSAGLGVDRAFRSAADSAEVFIAALNPTPLRLLRALMGDELPAAFRLTQIATAAVIDAQLGLNAGFKSAEDAARVFTAALNPTPLRVMRDAMSETAIGSKVVVTSLADAIGASTGLGRAFNSAATSAEAFLATLQPTPVAAFRSAMATLDSAGSLTMRTLTENIEAANGMGASFKSAAQSAQVFNAALDPSPLSTLRTLMASDIPAAAATTASGFQAVIEASVGLGRAFKSAEDSAAVFAKALDPSPLQQMRTLMADGLPQAAAATTVNFKAAIEATTGVDREFKSAAASAAVFTREIGRIPLAQLRTALTATASAGAATFRSLQENIDAANRISPALKSAAESASVFADALEGTTTPLQKMRTLMADDTPQQKAAHGSSMMTMELIRLGHEGMVGNWTRIPGTLMVLVEYSDTARNALYNMVTSFSAMQLAGVAALAAVAAGFVAMVIEAHKATVAINEATSAATMQGRSPAQARAEMLSYGESMRTVGVMGQTAMAQVSSSISQLGELTAAQKQKLAELGTQLFLNWDSDPKKTGEQLQQIFSSTSNLDSFLQKEHLLSDTQQRGWAAATTAAQKYDIGIAAIHDRLGPIGVQIKQQAEDAKLNLANQIAAAGLGIAPAPMVGDGAVFAPKHLGDFEPGTQQQDPAAREDTAAVIELNKHLQEEVKLKADLQHAQNALAADTKAGNTEAIAADQNAIKTAQDLIQMWKAQGDATWVQKQDAALNAILEKVAANATNTKTLTMEENRARIAFWDEQATRAGLTEEQITAAQRRASKARQDLSAEELRFKAAGEASWMAAQQLALSEILVKISANAKTSKALMEDENRARIAFWAKAAQQAGLTDKQITEAHAEGNKARLALAGEELRGGESAAKQALAAKLATLSEEQSANHNNYARVMEIESQKLALLASLGKEGTKQYEMELIKRDELMRAHATQQAEIARTTLSRQRSADTADLAAAKAAMDVEVAARRMSKAEEENALQDFALRQQAIEISAQQAYIDSVADMPKEYQAALDQMSLMKAQFAARDAQYNARMVTDQMAAWDRMLAPVESSVGGQVNEVLRGNATIGQAALHATGNIIVAYAEMGAKLAVQAAGRAAIEILWTGTEQSGKTAAILAGASARGAIATAETASENTGVLARLLRWVFGESTKTAVAASGTSARATMRAGETASENLGVFARLGRWIFGETAQTTATATGAAARTGIENASTVGSFLAGIGRRIAGWLGMESAQTAATIAGAGTREGIMTGEQLASMAGQKAFALGQVQTESVVAGAAAFADSAMLGPVGLAAAPEAAAAAAAAVMAMGAGLAVPLAVGAWNLPRDMPANLHAGEMVVPANFASGLRAAFSGGGGGGAANFSYAPTIHAGGGASPVDLDRVLGRSLNAMKSYFWQIGRNGSLTLPGR